MTRSPTAAAHWVVGVDSGGSGVRVALARTDGGADTTPEAAHGAAAGGAARGVAAVAGPVTLHEPVRTGARGIDAAQLLGRLVPAVRSLLADAGGQRLDAVCVGAAGMTSLGAELRAELPGALAREFGVRRTALAADAVTGYAGALGEQPGAVAAAGTGMIALGTDLHGWRRADGWGHLLGDCGGGAWVGRAGLEAALRAVDGRAGGSGPLQHRAEAVFGAPLNSLPEQLYPRTDRAAVLASFAPEVAHCAAGTDGTGDDPVAAGILRTAAREIADSAAAVCPHQGQQANPPLVAVTGGLVRLGEPLWAPLRGELAERLPRARLVPAVGDPLHGALLLAARLAHGELRFPADPALLTTS